MKFVGTGIVWDVEKDRVLCSFGKAREYNTENERTVKILLELGYKPTLTESEELKIQEDRKKAIKEELKEELRKEIEAETETKKKKG